LKTKSTRNIIIFIFIALICGWLGLALDKLANLEPSNSGETLGMAIWITFPFLAMILLRCFAGDGWKDFGIKPNFKGNIKWYFAAFFIYPLIIGIVLFIGKIFGWIDFSNFQVKVYFTGFFGLLVVSLIKNIFEESVWRGYLTAKLLNTKFENFGIYIIVGVVWGLWHLPYFLYFLPQSDIHQIFPYGRHLFALLAIITMICWTVMYVELFRLTKSIWVVVLLHAVEDSLVNHLIIDGHIVIASGKEILISPVCGIITSALYLGVGLLIRQYRIKNERLK